MELVIIIGIIILQSIVFYKVYSKVSVLKKFFPSVNQLSIKNREVEFNKEIKVNVDYINLETNTSIEFKETIDSTNSYLENNKGSAADFNIIKDITERHIETIVNSINSTISAPLFLGLAGTFFGIIYGLSFLEFSDMDNGVSVITTESISSLIVGVVTAMIASAVGLILTLINSAWLYKDALYINEKDKNNFYDFIQSKLLPKLSKDVSDSLGTLKSNLDHFNNKFGENLIHYKDSFGMLNQNLVSQKDFLEAVQEVGVVKLSNKIVKTFESINDASNQFEDFKGYQSSLNKTVSASIGVLKEYNDVSVKFANFNKNLDLVTDHIVESSDFYHQFKAFLESHFSEVEQRKNIFTNSIGQIDEVLMAKLKELSEKTLEQKDFYNDQWRTTVDTLNKDIVELFAKMTEYVQTEAESLKKYISAEEEGLNKIFESNKEFFKDFRYVEQLFTKFTAYAEVSNTHQKNIESGIKTITELLSNDASLINVNANLVEIKIALENINTTISKQNSDKNEQK
ncbi:MAG: hypothetical protein CMP67_10255 [Flavobacteriales bacterium]|nr:hypothetical protein [Flavobacteriales bacterium]|tara:strand:- start:7672 stop:9213 length:1542 start_codon:yes stop_codon:yes gene_type:complete